MDDGRWDSMLVVLSQALWPSYMWFEHFQWAKVKSQKAYLEESMHLHTNTKIKTNALCLIANQKLKPSG